MTHFVRMTVKSPVCDVLGNKQFSRLFQVDNLAESQAECQTWLDALGNKLGFCFYQWKEWECCDGSYNRDIWSHKDCPGVFIETESWRGVPERFDF